VLPVEAVVAAPVPPPEMLATDVPVCASDPVLFPNVPELPLPSVAADVTFPLLALAITAPELVEFVASPYNPKFTPLDPVVALLPSPVPDTIVPDVPVLYPEPNKLLAAFNKLLALLLFKTDPLPPVRLRPVVPLEDDEDDPNEGPNPRRVAAFCFIFNPMVSDSVAISKIAMNAFVIVSILFIYKFRRAAFILDEAVFGKSNWLLFSKS
jgi:hypothetical protein